MIAAGVDINAKIFDIIENLTVLHVAASNGHFEIVKLLIDKGADVNAKEDKYGDTAMKFAWSVSVHSAFPNAKRRKAAIRVPVPRSKFRLPNSRSSKPVKV